MNPILANYNTYNPYNNYHRPSEPSYGEYQEDSQEYTFLPKIGYFEPSYNSPLNATRQNTAATDSSEYQRIPSPTANCIPKNITHDFSCNITTFNGKEVLQQPSNKNNKFTAVLGTSTGISFNALSQDKGPMKVPFNLTMSDGNLEMEAQNEEEEKTSQLEEEETVQNQEAILNAQLKGLLKTGIWTEEKDQTLLKLGTQYKCDWKKIAKRFNHKKITPHFLKIRYKELTCAPLQRRIKFNHKEDLMISKYFEKYGSNWAQMATHFPDRTAIMLKNRYYSFIRKKDLLENLLREVREVEKNGEEVDKLPETDTYTNANLNSREMASSQGEDVSPSTMEDSFGGEKERKHHIFGYEAMGSSSFLNQSNIMKRDENVYESKESEELSRGSIYFDESSEISSLREEVKNWKNLYLQTKTDLDSLKASKMF